MPNNTVVEELLNQLENGCPAMTTQLNEMDLIVDMPINDESFCLFKRNAIAVVPCLNLVLQQSPTIAIRA
jgi:hypothetical protein